MYVRDNGTVGILNVTQHVSITNTTALTAAGSGEIKLGAKDSSVGAKATLDLRTEEAVVVVGTFTPSHKLAIWINGVEYHIQLDAV